MSGRKPSPIWAEFTQLSQDPLKYQCKGCKRAIQMQRPRADRLSDHLKTCKARSTTGQPLVARSASSVSEADTVEMPEAEDEVASLTAGGEDTFRPISPAPSTSAQGSTSALSSPSPVTATTTRKRPASSPSPSMDQFVQRTSEADRSKIEEKWAAFFFANRLSFRLADQPLFRAALEATRPGINGANESRPLLTRKKLSGKLLDEAEAKCHALLKDQLENKYATLSQDGWSDLHQEPVIAATLHADERTWPLDFQDTGSATKTAEFCAELAKASALKAEENFGCHVIGFVSDSEAKMVKVRRELADWREHFFVYGCSAHALNLVENAATPQDVMNKIVAVQRFFREHHKPSAMLKEKNGLKPKLPNDTRWTSQRATLQTFVSNWEHYCVIIDEPGVKVEDRIARFINNRGLVMEAKHMLAQLDLVAQVLNSFQSDKANLSDAVKGWLELMGNEIIKEDVRAAIETRFRGTVTPWHSLAFMLDNRTHRDRPELPADLQEEAREAVLAMGEGAIHAMAAYESEDTDVFPKMLFTTTLRSKMAPVKYWKYAAKTTTRSVDGQKFAETMAKIFSLPPTSAGIERVFSTAGLVQSKLRNRLNIKKVGRLMTLSRLLPLVNDVHVEKVELEELLEEEES